MKNKKQNLYRVFLTRHYIAVDYVEVRATSRASANRKAESYIRKARPDVRDVATDNGWHADGVSVTIEAIGQFGSDGKGRHPMVKVKPGFYVQKRIQYNKNTGEVL